MEKIYLFLKRMNFKLVFFSLTALTIGASSLQANLLISPTRIFFEPRERTKKIILKNTSTQKKTYKIFFKNLQMDDLGLYQEVESTSSDNSAAPYIRYSPRIITVLPRQSQTVRLLFRRKQGMVLPEYRSHLAFKELPPEEFGNAIGGDKSGNKVRLITLFEVTIPLIIKNGPEKFDVKIDGLQVLKEKEGTKLRLVFNRSGKTSAYGDIKINYQSPDSTTSRTIGQINRFFVYYPSKKRQVDVLLDLPKETSLKQGIIQIYYNKLQSNGGDLIAFTSLNLN